MAMRFGFSDTFQDSLSKLDNQRQQQVKSAMFDLQFGLSYKDRIIKAAETGTILSSKVFNWGVGC